MSTSSYTTSAGASVWRIAKSATSRSRSGSRSFRSSPCLRSLSRPMPTALRTRTRAPMRRSSPAGTSTATSTAVVSDTTCLRKRRVHSLRPSWMRTRSRESCDHEICLCSVNSHERESVRHCGPPLRGLHRVAGPRTTASTSDSTARRPGSILCPWRAGRSRKVVLVDPAVEIFAFTFR